MIYHADTLQLGITSKNQELFKIHTDTQLFGGVTTVTPYDKNNPKTFNTVISKYKQNEAGTFVSGVVDLRIVSNIY